MFSNATHGMFCVATTTSNIVPPEAPDQTNVAGCAVFWPLRPPMPIIVRPYGLVMVDPMR